MPTTFVDLDGVLADFETGFQNIFGLHHKSISTKEVCERIFSYPSFWENLPVMPKALQLYRSIPSTTPVAILTGSFRPMNDNEVTLETYRDNLDVPLEKLCLRCVNGKKAWCDKYLGPVEIIFSKSKNKQLYIREPGDILVDDNEDNIARWLAAGGFGILHNPR